jgi:hypothetical protein
MFPEVSSTTAAPARGVGSGGSVSAEGEQFGSPVEHVQAELPV